MHWDLLALRASDFENSNVVVLKHDPVTNGIDFGGVWGLIHDAPSLVSPWSNLRTPWISPRQRCTSHITDERLMWVCPRLLGAIL